MYEPVSAIFVLHASLRICFLRPDFTSNVVRVLAFETPKFYIAPYGKINHGLIKLSSYCNVKSDLSA